MMHWLSGHWVAVVVIVVGTLLARDLLRGIVLRKKLSDGRSRGIAFCNQCGWRGSVARKRQVCGSCGSLNLTLHTT